MNNAIGLVTNPEPWHALDIEGVDLDNIGGTCQRESPQRAATVYNVDVSARRVLQSPRDGTYDEVDDRLPGIEGRVGGGSCWWW